MYKILITSFAVLLSSLYSWGQDGKYANIGETIGQTIQMYDMDILYNETEPFIYKMNEKGKLKFDFFFDGKGQISQKAPHILMRVCFEKG